MCFDNGSDKAEEEEEEEVVVEEEEIDNEEDDDIDVEEEDVEDEVDEEEEEELEDEEEQDVEGEGDEDVNVGFDIEADAEEDAMEYATEEDEEEMDDEEREEEEEEEDEKVERVTVKEEKMGEEGGEVEEEEEEDEREVEEEEEKEEEEVDDEQIRGDSEDAEDDASFLKDAVASNGEILQPKPRAILGKPKNPNLMSILKYRQRGFQTVRYTPKGGKSMEFDISQQKEFDTVEQLITNASSGTVWRVLRYESSIPKKMQGQGGAYAPGFTTLSDVEREAKMTSKEATASVRMSEKSSPKKAARKDTTVTNTSPRKTSPKKKSAPNRNDKAQTNATSAKKPPPKTGTAKNVVSKKRLTKTKSKDNRTTNEDKMVKKNTKDTDSNKGRHSKSSPAKGKIVTVEKVDSDEDSLDLDNDEGLVESLAVARKESRVKRPLSISVSGSFANVADGLKYSVVIFPKPGKTFYNKAEHQKSLLMHALKIRKVVNPTLDGTWMDTISYYHMRDKEYGDESVWRRTSNNNTIDLVYFVDAVPIGEEESFESSLAAKIKFFFDVAKKRKTDVTGKAALNYALSLPTGAQSGLGKFCLNKGKGDAAKAAKIMTQEIVEHFQDGYSLQYDVPLNRFMVDYDIKEFLTKFVGVNSWDDLSEDDKKKCFRDYPKKSLPDWDEIAHEAW